MTDLRVGVSMGEWETVTSWKPDSEGSSDFKRDGRVWTVAFSKAKTFRNKTEITLESPVHTYGQWNSRLVAEAGDGSEHISRIGGSSGQLNGTVVFKNLPVSSIEEFRLQLRSYHCVEFDNISLQPGQKTQVKIISSEEQWAQPE